MTAGAATKDRRDAAANISFRCELLSADQLAMLAAGPLPSGLVASDARRSLHRDIYLDTADDSLGRRGIVCRLRTRADGEGTLTLRVASPSLNLEVATHGADVREALAARNDLTRRLRGIIDPTALGVRVDLEVDRLTRSALTDWLGRPRLVVHLDRVNVRRNGQSGAATFFQMCAHRLRGGEAELSDLERALELQYGIRASGIGTRERAELALKWSKLDDRSRERRLTYSDRIQAASRSSTPAAPSFLNAELSLLSFQARVLALAEDPATPLAERLRFLAIVSANVDEFFMVRMAGLAAAAGEPGEEQGDDGLTPSDQIAAVRDSVREIGVRQAACLRRCLAELSERGIQLRRWNDLSSDQQAKLTAYFRDEIQPLLTPFAMTLSPGHPLPKLAHLSLAVATVVRNRAGGPPRFAELELPRGVPRFFRVEQSDARIFISLEELVQGNLESLYPDSTLEQSFLFRVTRSAELELDEAGADDLLDEVARAAAQRGSGVAVRLEVDRGMPGILRALLLEDLRREQPTGEPLLSDVEEVDGLIDLTALTQLELPAESVARYPRFATSDPFAGATSVFDAISRGDVLVHHPFESFAASVSRFVRESADDPAVHAIKITLYRVGDPSAIADALVDAARAGKSVTAFVELKARFDETVNVTWARALEAAGGHVVRGLVGYKNHAKVALVIRRDGESLTRFVHIGTGNYNVRSAEQYTDLSLFSCDETIANDVAHLFNDLTGLSEPPRRTSRALLVAPHHLLPGVVERIEREAAVARAGRPARISAKVNGLSDPEVVRALYRASQDGVEIDLVVRGICTLAPGVPGRSERIRVRSVLGRFLEHSRIYRFANDGDPAYYIGSADLRPRNLRRRVELLVPVTNEPHRRRLDAIFDAYANDPTAWLLGADGEYVRRGGSGVSAQQSLSR
jgi:polyphosphate kinase